MNYYKNLIKRAEAGDAHAQFELADEYYTGDCEVGCKNEDDCEKKAFYWFEKAAEQGHIEACYYFAHCLYCRIGTRFSNPEGALPYALKSAEGGYVKAMEFLYELYSHGISCHKWDYEAAFKWLKKAAERGSTEAKFKLGKLYIEGFFLHDSKNYKFETNLAEGVKWLKAAAEEGDVNAINMIGDCYFNGTGVEKDVKKAMEWYERRPTDGGCSYKLGEIYLKGEHVDKDYKKAFDYFMATKWYAPSLKRAGDCYYNGWGVERDLDKAVYYYDCAAVKDEMGFYGSLAEVALIYARDDKLHDEKKTVKLLYKACNYLYNNPEVFYERAKRHLVGVDFRDENCRFENLVIRKDLDEAAYYFKKAAELGHVESQYEYGMRLLDGIGVEANKEEAVKWLKKSAEGGSTEAKEALERIEL